MHYTNLLVDDYYNWLLGLIERDDNETRRYSRVLEKLFDTEFYCIITGDHNRIEDGLELRNRFSGEIGEHLYFVLDGLPEYCTILEMMIALANRWEDEVEHDPTYGDRSPEWFWIMFENLGLYEFDDRHYDDYIIENILNEFLEREYCKDGTGGLFMVKNSSIDMRKTEIWYQINYYFEENSNKY